MIKEPIKVLIVDDHQLMIEGMKSLLEYENDIAFVAGSCSAQEAMDFLENNSVDVVLMDINMPGGSGIDATAEIKKQYPDIHVVALTMHDDISVITRMIEAGASGYILKRTKMHEVAEAIRTVCNNGRYLSNYTQQIIMENMSSNAEGKTEHREDNNLVLSNREKEVLLLITKEFSNEQIAKELFISERTVEAHRRNIFIKTQTKSVVGLMKYAINKGLIDIKPE